MAILSVVLGLPILVLLIACLFPDVMKPPIAFVKGQLYNSLVAVRILTPFSDASIHLRPHRTATVDPERVQDPAECRDVIEGKIHKNQQNHLSPWEARAIPNRRLKIAFGIKNAFTSEDKDYVKVFRDRAINQMASVKWDVVARFVRDLVKNRTRICGQRVDAVTFINLTSLVQALSLQVVRLTMFDCGEDDAKDTDLVMLAKSINRAWIASKQQNQLDAVPKFEDNHELQSSLAAVFGTHHSSRDNPLNLILPSFETLWRVVLRAFIEVRFTTGLNRPEWRDALIAFAKSPTNQQFESAKNIVNESLRLYTPTRRVHRAWSDGSSSPNSSEPNSYQILADLEACHLNTVIWGSDAKTFRPDRWVNPTAQQKKAFMPFGRGKFECPAKPVFGPRMIGVLVGALLVELDGPDEEVDWKLEFTSGKTLEAGVRLDTNRDAYGDLKLVRYQAQTTNARATLIGES